MLLAYIYYYSKRLTEALDWSKSVGHGIVEILDYHLVTTFYFQPFNTVNVIDRS